MPAPALPRRNICHFLGLGGTTLGPDKQAHALCCPLQIQAQLESLSLGLGPRAQALLELQRAAGALAKCSLKEHLPYVVLVYSESISTLPTCPPGTFQKVNCKGRATDLRNFRPTSQKVCSAVLWTNTRCCLHAGVYRVLNFPLQRAKLFTASWPYFPQVGAPCS